MGYEKWYEDHEKEILDGYFDYLRFPSVSAQKTHEKDVLECSVFIEETIRKLGFTVERWEGSGYPTIFGERIVDEKALTVLIYGHYDVQPPEPLDLWKSDPFQPEIRNGRVYARGAEDNKGQSYYSLMAIRAFLEKNSNAKLNLKLLIEGEEEMGSTTLSEILPTKEAKLKSDHLLIVDMGMGSKARPSLAIGARGIMCMEVKCKAMDIDAHSGGLGGIAYNPNRALAEVLSKAINEKGHITVPGFYDHVKNLSNEERRAIDFSFNREEYERELGLKCFHSEEGFSPMESNFIRPTFEVNGMWGGYTGDGFKTVIPKEAFAKISCRLVPNQSPQKIYNLVCDFINANIPRGMLAEFEYLGGGEAAWGDATSKTCAAVKKAYEKTFGSCHFILGGGSIPITSELKRYTGAEFVMPGTGLECDNIHAPNESFGLDQFKSGFLIVARSLEFFAEN